EHGGDLSPHPVGVLCVGEHDGPVRAHVRHGAARADRHVALVAVRVGRRDRAGCAGEGGVVIALVEGDPRRGAARRVERPHLAQRLPLAAIDGGSWYTTLSRAAASHSFAAITPRKSPRRTTRASPTPRIERSSTATIPFAVPSPYAPW